MQSSAGGVVCGCRRLDETSGGKTNEIKEDWSVVISYSRECSLVRERESSSGMGELLPPPPGSSQGP